MIVDTMSVEEIVDEVNNDLFDITNQVFDSARNKGKIKTARNNFIKRLSPFKRRDLYTKIEYNHTTRDKNKWKCIVHIFKNCEIWQGFTGVKGSKNIRTVFYEYGKVFFVDMHFFQRYRERYLEVNNIETSSAADYFNANNDVFTSIPQYLGELQLNNVMVLLKHGIGLGEKIDYVGKATKYKTHIKLSNSNYRINTFIGFDDLKKNQLEDIIGYLNILKEVLEQLQTPNSNPFDRSIARLNYEQIKTVAPRIIKQYEPYMKKH